MIPALKFAATDSSLNSEKVTYALRAGFGRCASGTARDGIRTGVTRFVTCQEVAVFTSQAACVIALITFAASDF
jgi:hypothetical protein